MVPLNRDEYAAVRRKNHKRSIQSGLLFAFVCISSAFLYTYKFADRRQKFAALDKTATAASPVHSQVYLQVADWASAEKPSKDNDERVGYYMPHFHNVHVDVHGITVYYDDTKKFTLPSTEHNVNLFTGNNRLLLPPTGFKARLGSKSRSLGYDHLPVNYLPASKNQPNCTTWIEDTAYIVTVGYPNNIFHVFHEGLLPMFGVLRMSGVLPLIQIDSKHRIKQVASYPPWHYDFSVGDFVRSASFDAGDIPSSCDTKLDEWCKEGVWNWRKIRGNNLVLIPWSDKIISPRHEYLYAGFTPDIRSPELLKQGVCFKDIIFGNPRALDFWKDIRSRETFKMRLRVSELELAKNYILTVDRYMREYDSNWQDDDPGLERLRQGVTVEDIQATDALIVTDIDHKFLNVSLQAIRELERIRGVYNQMDWKTMASESLENRERKTSRPVVTYITRRTSARRVCLNDEDILKYILVHYDVTVKLTTCYENLWELGKILGETDVVISLHGAGLLNLLFVKQQAVLLEMFPCGWNISGYNPRGGIYNKIIKARNGTYTSWICNNLQLAFFRTVDTDNVGIPSTVHPNLPPKDKNDFEQLPWYYLHSYIDLEDFAPHIDRAMKAANIPKIR